MKKNASILIAFTLWANYLVAFAQAGSNKEDSLSLGLKQIAEIESTPVWIKFKTSAQINPKTFFEDYKVAFRLSDFDTMIVGESVTDDIGFTHCNYQQFYKSISIDGESVNVHTSKNGETYAATGRILKKNIYLLLTFCILFFACSKKADISPHPQR